MVKYNQKCVKMWHLVIIIHITLVCYALSEEELRMKVCVIVSWRMKM